MGQALRPRTRFGTSLALPPLGHNHRHHSEGGWMSFVVKKRDLTDPAQLQALIVEHADDLERGLTMLDSRLLLGQAAIDIVGVDADGVLILIAVGLVADEEMFLKAVDAYSWCLEYPEAIHRLYPTVQFS